MSRRWVVAAIVAVLVAVGVVVAVGSGEGDDAGRDDDTAAPSGVSGTAGSGDGTEPAGAGDGTDTTADPADDVASAGDGAEAPPVPLDEPADFGDGVEVRLAAIEATEAEGNLPGERSGPAVAITVEVTNGSGRDVDLGNTQDDLVDADGRSATPIVDPERTILGGRLAPGESASGTYVFSAPPEARTDMTVRIKYSGDTPTVLFVGDLPDG